MKQPIEPLVDEVITFDTPLVFSASINTANIKNLLLIDSLVSESQIFYDSANSSTFPVIYSYESNVNDFKSLLTKFSNIDRISFVFHDNILNGKIFINGQLLFTQDDLIDNTTSFSQNTQLLIDTIKKLNVKHIDFLACNSLNYPNWVKFYNLLNKQTNVVVGASNNKTGNLKYGTDWVMENTNENVVNTYFNSNIQKYTASLASTISQAGGIIYIQQSGTDIQYQSNSTSGAWTTVDSASWPVTFVNDTPAEGTILTIQFYSNLTITSVSQYFITGSNYITYDGTGKTVTINSVSNYVGLIYNGNFSLDGFHGITVKNINSQALLSTLNSTSGKRGAWICQPYFGKNIKNIIGCVPIRVDNCSNSGIVNAGNTGGIFAAGFCNNGIGNITNCSNSGVISGGGAGGICGGFPAQSRGIVSLTNCSNTGVISGAGSAGSGGICGSNTGDDYGILSLTNCYNTGEISNASSGGICGSAAGSNYGILSLTNCYNTGEISNASSGGICGGSAGARSGILSLTNCSNTGIISGSYCGGICGDNTGYLGSVTITNCSNTGIISGYYSGGITGDWFGAFSKNQCSITNCYNIGNITGAYSGGICGAEVGFTNNGSLTNISISGCYSLGDIATNSGGILGGTGENGAYTATVNITNCYTSYNAIVDAGSEYVANSLQIKASIIKTNVYTQFINSWSDSLAQSALTGTPTSLYVSNPAATWTTTQTNTPYILSTFNANIYNQNMVTNPDGNYTSPAGLFTPNYSYKLISVNDSLPTNVSIDNTNGKLTFVQNQPYTNYVEKVFASKGSSPYYYGYNLNNFTLNQVLCFKEGSKILAFNSETNVEEYIEIEKLRKGDLVKTILHGYKPISHIGYSKMYNQVNEVRSKGKLYKCSNSEFPEVFEDLVITGCHSILVKEFKETEREETKEILGEIYVTDAHYRLPACVDKRTKIYEEEGVHTVWHFSLENNDYYYNYGVYANGLLVETTSNRMMKELSGAQLIE